MELFQHLLLKWDTSANNRLKELGKDVRKDVNILNKIISDKLTKQIILNKYKIISKGALQIKKETFRKRKQVKSLLLTQNGKEELNIRVMLIKAQLLNPQNRQYILEYLNFLYAELRLAEILLKRYESILDQECKVLNKIKITKYLNLYELKTQIASLIKEEEKIALHIRITIKGIHNKLADRILHHYYGPANGIPCPKCTMKYTEIRREERGSGNIFYCHFCGHIKNLNQ